VEFHKTKVKITPLDPWIRKKITARQPELTRQVLEAWQIQKVNETLALARANSSYYRKHFAGMPEAIGALEDLAQFPFTSADDIRCNPLQFVCVSQDEIRRVVTLQSSGTTGEPKRLYFTAEDQELTIDFFGVGMSTLTDPGDRVLILLPGKTPGGVGDLLRLGLLRQGRESLPYGPVIDPLHALATMENQQADCLVGSPTQVLGLARRWNPKHKAPRTVLLSTDYVPAAIARVLENIWGCQVFNHYGTTEMGLGGGVECEAHSGYHLREADLYFEVVHPITGETLPDGEYGEIVFTTLTRHGMPLIRYRMGDRSRFISASCPCGTTLRTLEKVRGRFSGLISSRNDILELPDFDEALFPIPDLLNFTLTLFGDEPNLSVTIETQMLTSANSARLVEKALETIPVIKNMEVTVLCQHKADEAGNIHKRIIFDKRGKNA